MSLLFMRSCSFPFLAGLLVNVNSFSYIFLKLDTQGFDLNVLDGVGAHAGRILALQSEIAVKPIYDGMTGYMHAIAAMNGRGFELTGLFPVLRDRQLRIVEFDCVMVRSHAHPAG